MISRTRLAVGRVRGLEGGRDTTLGDLAVVNCLRNASFLLLLYVTVPLGCVLSVPRNIGCVNVTRNVLFVACVVVLVNSTVGVGVPL